MILMSEIELIKSPWENVLFDLVEQTEESLRFTSPYIKSKPVEKMISAKGDDVSIECITSFKVMNYYRKSSDLKALNTILNNNGIIRNHQPLHSKIYIFDETQAIVTSGNLTHGGLNTNYEYGVLIKDKNNVSNVIKDFYDIFNSSITGDVTSENIDKVKQMIQVEAQEKETKFKLLPYEEDECDIFDVGLSPIVENLTGWKLEVFNCLQSIENRTFELNEAYDFEAILSEKHPENNTIKDQIRKQLQNLRDLGLIEFTGNRGVYRKLWK